MASESSPAYLHMALQSQPLQHMLVESSACVCMLYAGLLLAIHSLGSLLLCLHVPAESPGATHTCSHAHCQRIMADHVKGPETLEGLP